MMVPPRRTASGSRYRADVKRILRQLKRDFNQEQGAKAGRPAAKLFEGWVEAAVERRAAVESRPPTREVLQLEMFQLGDPGQIAAVHGLLRNDPSVIRYYLRTHVFPETMKAQQTKISASGQELGARLGWTREHQQEFSTVSLQRGVDLLSICVRP